MDQTKADFLHTALKHLVEILETNPQLKPLTFLDSGFAPTLSQAAGRPMWAQAILIQRSRGQS